MKGDSENMEAKQLEIVKKETVSRGDEALEFLRTLRKGAAAAELGEALAEVVAAVEETGRKGTVVMRVEIKPTGKGGGMMALTAESTAKAPKVDPESAFFFPTKTHGLTRQDPRQTEMFEE